MLRPRILIVDDEAQIRRLLRVVLEGSGYDIDDVDDGSKALARVEVCKPDLVITDLVMPDQEGMSLIRSLRELHPDLAIIAMSGARGGTYLPVARAMGASATLAKPFNPTMLLAEVKRILQPTGKAA